MSFTCSMCKATFDEEWTDEEARAEYAEAFPGSNPDKDASIVCDDCYHQVMGWVASTGGRA